MTSLSFLSYDDRWELGTIAFDFIVIRTNNKVSGVAKRVPGTTFWLNHWKWFFQYSYAIVITSAWHYTCICLWFGECFGNVHWSACQSTHTISVTRTMVRHTLERFPKLPQNVSDAWNQPIFNNRLYKKVISHSFSQVVVSLREFFIKVCLILFTYTFPIGRLHFHLQA